MNDLGTVSQRNEGELNVGIVALEAVPAESSSAVDLFASVEFRSVCGVVVFNQFRLVVPYAIF